MDGVQLCQATKPLRGDCLLFTIKFPRDPGTYLIDLRRMKGWVDFGVTSVICCIFKQQ